MSTALWQRCAVHFLRNASDYNTRRADPACLDGLKRMWDYEDVDQAHRALQTWMQRWGDESGCDKLVSWVEAYIKDTVAVYRLPLKHRRRMKSTNMLERYNEEIRHRTRVVRISTNEASCLRLIRALAAETHDLWISSKCYLTGDIGLMKVNEPPSQP